MFALRIHGQFLELDDKSRLQYNWKNHLFSEAGVIPGSYSIPFEVPASDINLQLLGNPDILEAQNRPFQRIPAVLFLGDDGGPAPFKDGEVRVRSVGDGRISLNFLSGLATLGSGFTEQSIRNIARHQFTLTTQPIQRRVILRAVDPADIPSTRPRTLRVNGQTFTGAFGAELANAINDGQEDVLCYLNFEGSGSFREFRLSFTPRADIHDLESALHIQVPEDERARWEWVEGTGTAFDKNYLQNYFEAVLPFFNAYMQAEPVDPILRFPTLHIPDFYEPDRKALHLANYSHTTGEFAPNEIRNLTAHNVNSGIPCVRLAWVLEQISLAFGLKLEGDFFEEADFQELLLIPQTTLDKPQSLLGDVPIILFRLSFNAADFLPDISPNELIKQLAMALCLEVDYEPKARRLRLNSKATVIAGDVVADLTPHAAPYNPRTLEERSTLTFKPRESTEEQELRLALPPANNPFLPFSYTPEGAESEQTIPLNSSSLPMVNERAENFSLFIPRMVGRTNENFGLRWLFWRGLGTSSKAHSYPLASLQTDSHSLSFYGSTGLFARRWKAWAEFLSNRTVIALNAYFSVAQLLGHVGKNLYLFDRKKYLIGELTINANLAHVEDSRLLLYGLPASRSLRPTAWRGVESSAYCLSSEQDPGEDPGSYASFPIRWGRLDPADAPVIFDDEGDAQLNPNYNPPGVSIIEALDGAGAGSGLRFADNRLGRYDGIDGAGGYLAFFMPSDFGIPQFWVNNYPQTAWQFFDYPGYEYTDGETAPYTLYVSHTVQHSAIDVFEVR